MLQAHHEWARVLYEAWFSSKREKSKFVQAMSEFFFVVCLKSRPAFMQERATWPVQKQRNLKRVSQTKTAIRSTSTGLFQANLGQSQSGRAISVVHLSNRVRTRIRKRGLWTGQHQTSTCASFFLRATWPLAKYKGADWAQ